MRVLSKSLAAMVAAATLVEGGAFAVAGTAYAADNDAITVTPNPVVCQQFRWLGHLAGLVRQRHRQPRRGIGHHHQSRR